MEPGSLRGLQLVVRDLRAAHAQLLERDVEVGPVQVMVAAGARLPTDDDALNFAGFIFFKDPAGNGWAVQQLDARA